MSVEWTPGETIDTECPNCGAHVSKPFRRVFEVDGELEGCPKCKTNRELGSVDLV